MTSLQQLRSRRIDRKQRRQWRRERTKQHIDAHDARTTAESSLYKHGFFTH